MERIKLAFLLLVLIGLSGCEGGIDFTGAEKEDKGVNVYMTIVLSNAHTSPVYTLLENESQDGSNLVAPNSSRTIEDSRNLTADSRYDHIYELVIKARWGEGNYVETTHYVDYKKWELDFEDGLEAAPKLSLRITATFDGTKLTVTEMQI